MINTSVSVTFQRSSIGPEPPLNAGGERFIGQADDVPRGEQRRDRLTSRLRGELRVLAAQTTTAAPEVLAVRAALERLAADDRRIRDPATAAARSPPVAADAASEAVHKARR